MYKAAPVHAMKAHAAVKVQLYSVLDGVSGWLYAAATLLPG
jgi:hypothetical protein